MKIVHITTRDEGGAGLAAIRLHEALIKRGVASSVLCLDKKTNNPLVQEIKDDRSILRKINDRFGVTRRLKLIFRILRNNKGTYEMFSIPFSYYRLHKHPAVLEADIIHLHWISNFVDYKSFFRNVKKPIVWTLHDMNPFLGSFHYENDLNGDNSNLLIIEHQFRAYKREAFNGANINFVFLCDWMKLKAEQFLLKIENYAVIPNCLNTSTFKPMDKFNARSILGLPQKIRIALFLAENITNRRKMFSRILDCAGQLENDKDLIFVGVGRFNLNNQPTLSNVILLGEINGGESLNMVYNSADFVIIPSLEDNLPNILLEALCAGKPVIAYDNGGMKEYVRERFNGIILQNDQTESGMSLKYAIETLPVFNSEKIRQEAVDNFSEEVVARKMCSYYAESVNRSAYK